MGQSSDMAVATSAHSDGYSTEPDSDSDTAYVGLEDLKFDLGSCLDDLQRAGSFAIFEALSSTVNPGLSVKGAGTIGLPLSERDAKAIIEASHQAPYGKGSETIVDVRVRKTWELSPDSFEVRNPAWQQVIVEVLEKIGQGMGLTASGGKIKAELYKMLLYEKDAMFKPHQDSEKAPGMFGTLVICLPSKHEGGEVRLTHSRQSRIFETATHSEFGLSFMSWFSDVIHEVLPVQSGRRLVLTYNLIYTGGVCGSASTAIKADARLRAIIASWTKSYNSGLGEGPHVLAYKLEHQYTNASLRYDALKGHDGQVAKHLREACSASGSYFYLANLERTVEGGCEDDYDGYYSHYSDSKEFHEIIEETDVSLKLSQVVDLSGTVIANDITIKEEDIIQEDVFDRDPDDEDYEGYTGNEGTSATHYYRDTVAIIIPKGARVTFLLGSLSKRNLAREQKNAIMKKWLKDLGNTVNEHPSDPERLSDLLQVCRIVVSEMKDSRGNFGYSGPPYSDEIVEEVLKVAVEAKQKPLFLDVLTIESKDFPPSGFVVIGKGIPRFGFKSLEAALNTRIAKLSKFHERCHALTQMVECFEAETSRLATLQPSAVSLGELEKSLFFQWRENQVKIAFVDCELGSSKDGSALIDLSISFKENFMFNEILPVVKKHSSSTDLVMAFLMGLLKAGEDAKISKAVTLDVFRDVLPGMVHRFSLVPKFPTGTEVNKRQRTGWQTYRSTGDGGNPPLQASVQPSESSHDMATLVCKILALGMTVEVDQIISKIISQVHMVPIQNFETVLLPFLKVLVSLLLPQGTLSAPRFRSLFQHILALYIDRYVLMEPAKPIGWSRTKKGCGCHDCIELDRFIVSPGTQVARFPMAEGRRRHLEGRLSGDRDYTYSTIREGSPHTLFVKKTTAMVDYKKQHSAWQQRCTAASTQIKSIGEEPLKDMLGDQFDAVMGLKWLKIGGTAHRPAPISYSSIIAKTAVDKENQQEDIEVIVLD